MKFGRCSASDAFKAVIGNKYATIPKQSDQDSRLTSPVKPAIHNSFTFDQDAKIFTIGSCFARNIENFLHLQGLDLDAFQFDVPKKELNQFAPSARSLLNKYTPHSMTNEVASAFGELNLEACLLEESEGQYLDMQLHTSVAVSKARALERRAYINGFNKRGIANADVIVITLGLIEAWFDTESQIYTNQTPSYKTVKKFPNRFQFEVMSPSSVNDTITNLIDLLLKYGKSGHKVLLTVSPVPLGRSFSGDDVLIANSYSKSVLRTFAAQITAIYDHVDYVPTYEAITLSDREQTWAEDSIHVQDGAVQSIVGHVLENYLGSAPNIGKGLV